MANYQFLFSRQAKKDIAELSQKQKIKLQEIQHFALITGSR
jgi:hypothetical protein